MRYGFSDITLYYSGPNEQDFNIRCNLISALYVNFLGGYKPKGTTRISARLGEEDYIQGYADTSILSVGAKFDNDEFWSCSADVRDKIILATIHRVALFCADRYGWGKSRFEIAYNEVLTCGFIYRQALNRKYSKDKKYQACLLVEKDGLVAIVSVQFYDANGAFIKSIELHRFFDHPMFFDQIIRNYKWFGNQDFGVHAQNEELVIKASLDKINSEIIFSPVKKSLEELKGFLRMITFTYDELTTQSDFIRWANK